MKHRMSTLLLLYLVISGSSPATAQPAGASPIQVVNPPACLPSSTEPVEVQFVTEAPPDATAWSWDFGNDQQSFLRSPVALYDQLGNYTVSLTVTAPPAGDTTTVRENLIQINQLKFKDDFSSHLLSLPHWHGLHPGLVVDSAVEFEILADPTGIDTYGEQNGEIICINGDGGPGTPGQRTPPGGGEPDGRFLFDLELIAEGHHEHAYTAFRLLANGHSSTPKVIAELRVQWVDGAFWVRIEGPVDAAVDAAPWHRLSDPWQPGLSVDIDWYRDDLSNTGVLRARLQEHVSSRQPVIQQLTTSLDSLEGFDTIALGVMNLYWFEEYRAGRMRIDNFNLCEFEHRPGPQ